MIILGGVGVSLALPRRSVAPQVIGALIAALAMGGVLIVMGLTNLGNHPNLYFYVFSLVGLGSALRVITHPRPVYAALYFILTVIATAGLFVVLSAEFMAFALIIIYAGAILITYLFVIMLATQAPEESEVEVFADYDVKAREPIAATVAGFLLLAVLTTLMFRGVNDLQQPAPRDPDALIAQVPRKIERMLRSTEVAVASPEGGAPRMVPMLAKDEDLLLDSNGNASLSDDGSIMIIAPATGETRALPRDQWPADLRMGNVEELGFNLLRDHPGTIEIAGIILLMAMLGAVVLSRKQVELDEDAKDRQSRLLAGSELAEGVSPSANSPKGAAGGVGL